MNVEKQIAIGKYRNAVEQLTAIKKAWENLKNLKENFCNPYCDNFVCVSDFNSDEKITDGIFAIEITLKRVEEKYREEKLNAEIELENFGIEPREIDEIIFA